MEQLGPTLTEFYSPTTSNERKQQLEQGLHAFQAQPSAVATVLEIVVSIVSEERGKRFRTGRGAEPHESCCSSVVHLCLTTKKFSVGGFWLANTHATATGYCVYFKRAAW